jgi:hypothetical protein
MISHRKQLIVITISLTTITNYGTIPRIMLPLESSALATLLFQFHLIVKHIYVASQTGGTGRVTPRSPEARVAEFAWSRRRESRNFIVFGGIVEVGLLVEVYLFG